MMSDGRSRVLREIKDRVVSLSNHLGLDRVGGFDKLSDRQGLVNDRV